MLAQGGGVHMVLVIGPTKHYLEHFGSTFSGPRSTIEDAVIHTANFLCQNRTLPFGVRSFVQIHAPNVWTQ